MNSEIITLIISYIGVLIIAFLIVAIILKGFIGAFMKVKGSRGGKVLVKIRSIMYEYYRPGTIEEGFLVYRDRNKNNKRISIPSNSCIYRSLGVNCVDVSEELNCIVDINYNAVEGFDADRYNSLYLRALYRPTILDQKQQIILFLLIAIIILIIISVFMNYQNGKKIELIRLGVEIIKPYFIHNNITAPVL